MSCKRCDALSQGLLRTLNKGIFPNQSKELIDHKCVFCGENMYELNFYRKPALRHGGMSDLSFCEKAEETKTYTNGFLWWKTHSSFVTNKGCPEVPHLHRTCPTCHARWIERTAVQETQEKLFLEIEAAKELV